MIRNGCDPALVEKLIFEAAKFAGDEEATSRAKAVKATASKIAKKETVNGWPIAIQLLGEVGEEVAKKCCQWLGLKEHTHCQNGSNFSGELKAVLASDVAPTETQWFLPGLIPREATTLVEGDPGVGKSTFCCYLAAIQSAGLPLPDGTPCDPGSAAILSIEDNLSTTVVPRLCASGADVKRVHLISELEDASGNRRLISIPDDLDFLQKYCEDHDIRLLIIEPLVAFLSEQTNSHKDQHVRRALGPLKTLAEECHLTIIAVRHLTKNSETTAMYRGGGSIGLIASVRSALLIAPAPDDANSQVLVPVKANLAKKPVAWRFCIESKSGITEEGNKWEAGAIKMIGLTEYSANDVVSTTNPQTASAIADAVEFLQEVLANGPVSQKKLAKIAKENGHSKSTLQRAAKKIGVKKKKTHDDNNMSWWEWSLPKQDDF